MKFLLFAALLCTSAVGQVQLPPGTSSSVPDSWQASAPSAQAIALQRAEDAISAGKYQEAVSLLTSFALPAQKDPRVFYDLGFAQDALNNDAEAATAYRAALERNPADGTARVSLGLLLARDGNRASAEEQLARAVNTTGMQPEIAGRALRALAQMHTETNSVKAAEDLAAALKLSPETPADAALAAEIADAQHDDSAAVRAYMHAQAMAPGDPEVALGYARLLSRQKKFAEAEQALEGARQAHPENRALMAEFASQELLLNHTAQALPLLERLHQSDPGDAAAARLLATSYIAVGNLAKAESLYAALLKAAPADATRQVDWADCLIREKRSAEAEPVLQRVVFEQGKTLPNEVLVNAAGMLAFAASSNRDPETVLKALALREGLTSPTAAYTFLAATAHDTFHHTKQAADQYRLFLQQAGGKFPDQEWQARQRLQILDRTK